MINDKPVEIVEAVRLLEKAEVISNLAERSKYFAEGTEILEDYLNDNPNSVERTFIENIRLTYTRKMLYALAPFANNVPLQTYDQFMESLVDADRISFYCLFCSKNVKKEVAVIRQSDKQLQHQYPNFFRLYDFAYTPEFYNSYLDEALNKMGEDFTPDDTSSN